MRNIRKPVVRILLNTLDYTVAGLYNDYNSSRKVMTFKKLGIQIVGQASNGSKASPADPVIGASGLASGLSVAKSTTASGNLQLLLMAIEPPAPCETCNWGYGVRIREKVKLPGVHSNRANVETISYGDTMASVGTSGGYVTDAYQLLAENDIITQIKNNEGKHIAEQRYPMKMTGSAVEARRAYKLTIDGSNAANATFTDEDGVETTVTMTTAKKTSAEAINDNATIRAYCFAVAGSGTNEVYVFAKENGGLFTVADGGGTGTLTITERYIAFTSKDDEIQFDVLVDKQFGATFSKVSVYTLSGMTGAGTTTVTVDGTSTAAANDSATEATMATNINTALSNASITDVYATGDPDETKVFVFAASTAQVVSFAFNSLSTTTLSVAWSGYPHYPSLTSEDVFRIFWNNKDGGAIAAMQYGDQPIEGEDYNVYYLKNDNLKITSLHGAGYNQTGEVEYEIYVKKSLCTTNLWDADAGDTGYAFMVAPTSADTTWEGLLGILTGLAVTSW